MTTPGKAEKFLRVRLRGLQLKTGLTQEAYAELAKFSYKYYQGIERGQWSNLRLRTLEKIAEGYGVSLYELFSPKMTVPRVKITQKKVKSCAGK